MAWDGRRYLNGHGPLPDGQWLILANALEPGTGMYWLETKLTVSQVRDTLAAQMGKGACDVSNHGIRYYIWRI